MLDLAKILSKQFVVDFDRSGVYSGSAGCPADNIEHFC